MSHARCNDKAIRKNPTTNVEIRTDSPKYSTGMLIGKSKLTIGNKNQYKLKSISDK